MIYSKYDETDVIILGGGPAGLSAALWCSELRLDSIVIDRAVEPGGQLLNIHGPIKNYAGLSCADGRELTDTFIASLAVAGYRHLFGTTVDKIDVETFILTTTNGKRLAAKAMIIATGVRRRKLGVAGEDRFAGKGILGSGVGDARAAAGQIAMVIGGGDAAAENALILGKVADRILLVHRRDKLSAREEFVGQLVKDSRIEIRPNTIVKSFEGADGLESVVLSNVATNDTERFAAQIALIRIGVEPNSELLQNSLELDDAGYILIDSRCETSTRGIFAVGDVANPGAPTIATAAGNGATAAKQIFSLLKTPRKL
ncbi:MAG: NAD(P)/FAD-dependent oxidoreductase [Pyrinomonadaceae bacterium]